MALDGILLSKIVPQIAASLPCRIQKIYQISSQEILFQIHGSHGKQQLLISCHSEYNRMLLSDRSYPTPDEPGNFIMVLRKYLEGASFESIEQASLDRWCLFQVRRRNDLGDVETMKLYVELMGKYANVILVSSSGKIIDALKRIPPFENNHRVIQPGADFHSVEPQNKRNPFEDCYIEEGKSLIKQFAGFSPFLAREAEYRMAHGQSFASIMEEIKASTSLYIAKEDPSPVFHCIELTSVGPCRSYPLFEGFDILYYHKEEKDRIKEISGDVYHACKKQLKHETQKLPRLLKEYDEARDCQKWNTYGTLLYSYGIQDTKGDTSIILKDFETGEDVTIPLDPRLNGVQNAQKCFNRYQKLKKGQKYLQEQIDICQNEISYFNGLLEQLDQADFKTAEEIKQELIKGGYMEENQKGRRPRRRKNEEPHITTFTMENGVSISFGRNNLQNDALTWHKARKNEIWLHAKDYHGSHVVIHTDQPDEATLRLAANIAAYFSKGRDSSSVPVNWCPVKNLKKIPGAKPGMVQLGSYRTIYIDPDASQLAPYGILEPRQ